MIEHFDVDMYVYIIHIYIYIIYIYYIYIYFFPRWVTSSLCLWDVDAKNGIFEMGHEFTRHPISAQI